MPRAAIGVSAGAITQTEIDLTRPRGPNLRPRRVPQPVEACVPEVRKSHKFPYVFGALGGIRTPDPQIRSLVLYPAELRAPQPFLMNSPFEFHLSFARPQRVMS